MVDELNPVLPPRQITEEVLYDAVERSGEVICAVAGRRFADLSPETSRRQRASLEPVVAHLNAFLLAAERPPAISAIDVLELAEKSGLALEGRGGDLADLHRAAVAMAAAINCRLKALPPLRALSGEVVNAGSELTRRYHRTLRSKAATAPSIATLAGGWWSRSRATPSAGVIVHLKAAADPLPYYHCATESS